MKPHYITVALLSFCTTQWAVADTAGTAAPSESTDEHPSANRANTLQTVTIRAKAARALSEATNSYQRDRVNLGLLGRQNAFTAPISVVNYDEKAFADKQPRHIVDGLAQTDASVMAFGGETNTLQGIYVRGLQLDARQFSVNGLAGMYSAYSSPTANVGAAQLIKGASSATVGMDPEGAVGAAVNIETKKAGNEGHRHIGLAWFGQSRMEPSLDIGQRFGANQQFGARLNGKFRQGDTPRDHFSEQTKEVALNLDYRGERFQAAIDAMYAKRHSTGGRARVQDIQLYGFRLPDAPRGHVNLSPAWQAQTTKDQSVQFTFDWLASDWVAVSGGIGHMASQYKGNFAQVKINPNGTFGNAVPNARGVFNPQGARPFHFDARTTSANLKARGYVQTGSISHNWNVAADYVKRSRDHDSAAVSRNHFGMNNLNLYAPQFPAAPDLSRSTLVQGADTTYTAPSLAFSDTLGFADDTWRFTLGGRLQWIKQENHTDAHKLNARRFSPMMMAAYVPRSDFVLYGNYLEDLEPGAVDDEGHMSEPRVSRQIELGVRKNWGDIVTGASIYQITRPTFWRQAGTYQGVRHFAGQTQGKERNRGIELNAYANLWDKTLRPYLGISYIQADLIDSPTYLGQLTTGTQVSSPRIIAKAGVQWDTPFARGLTLNIGVQHYGKSYQDTQKQHAFPAYTIMDMGAKYVWNIKDKHALTIRTGIENVFDKNYWQVQRGQQDRSFALVGMPRTFWLKADYSF